MKRGVLLVLLVLSLSGCRYEQGNISYPQILSNSFTNTLIAENNIMRENISNLKELVKLQDEEIEVLSERLNEYGKQNIKKGGPYDWIKKDSIDVEKNQIIINLENATIASIADTHSLEPLVLKYSNVIEIVPKSEEDIHLGDLVSYLSEYSNETILHRVISIGMDEIGWYATMKGDNNLVSDPGKIRFSQIKRVVVAIIY